MDDENENGIGKRVRILGGNNTDLMFQGHMETVMKAWEVEKSNSLELWVCHSL